MTRSDGYYLRLEEKYHRDPVQADFGPAHSLANPAGFRAYMVMARYDPKHTVHKVTDLYGHERWLSPAGWRVMCQALLYIGAGRHTTTRELAGKIGCCRQTVSRWIQKLTAWGVIGSGIVRGKYGGIVLFARRVGDNLEHCANVARAAIRARFLKVHPPAEQGAGASYQLPPYLVSKGAPLDFERDQRLAEALGCDPSRANGRLPCPAHGEHTNRTLSWKWAGDRLLVHCFAGCTFDEIRKAVA